MSHRDRRALVPMLASLVGVALLALTLRHTDLRALGAIGWRLGAALPLALLPSAAWHVVRTLAWRACFAPDTVVSFARLWRVRLAAEAFSYLTIRGVAGEPLKVVLLRGRVPMAAAAAAVAIERIAYMIATAAAVGIAAAIAATALPLTHGWTTAFRTLAIAVGALMAMLLLLLRRAPPDPTGIESPTASTAATRLRRFGRELRHRLWELVHGDRRRLGTLALLEAVAYGLMALEVWIVLRAMGVPVGAAAALAIESLTRVASMLSAFIPGGLGSTEASNVVAATALQAAGGAAALALVRRLRGLIWCAAGLAVAPSTGPPA